MKIWELVISKVYAATRINSGPILKNPLKAESLQALTADILNLVYKVGLPLVVIMIIYSGFLYVKARGNSSEISKAHEAIKWTLIGAAIVLGASVISFIIKGTIDSLAK